jgi:hypothetical protein
MKYRITRYSNMIGNGRRRVGSSWARNLDGFTLDATIRSREGSRLRVWGDEGCKTVREPKHHRNGMSEINTNGRDACELGMSPRRDSLIKITNYQRRRMAMFWRG